MEKHIPAKLTALIIAKKYRLFSGLNKSFIASLLNKTIRTIINTITDKSATNPVIKKYGEILSNP
ncbi:MAG: hypothetical protein A3J73_04410 [Planctomycetes bacterium RIFCSPHIGHO2_02_FULL_38_41]|nr:MAG: hypothetical protein A3J73_04410 [Planctomycetes bacterium RIFCSPHIGHO2_02_FULL_38_41]OHB96832.1 MAG: hypothetical protein A2W74_01530 [Planctomycetes bacterium RIFCSPLOWO2_12_38_17]